MLPKGGVSFTVRNVITSFETYHTKKRGKQREGGEEQ